MQRGDHFLADSNIFSPAEKEAMHLPSKIQIYKQQSRQCYSQGLPQIPGKHRDPTLENEMPANDDSSQQLSPMGLGLSDPHAASPLHWAVDDDRAFILPRTSPSSLQKAQKQEASTTSRRPNLQAELPAFPEWNLLSNISREDPGKFEQRHAWHSPGIKHARFAEHQDWQAQAGVECTDYTSDNCGVILPSERVPCGSDLLCLFLHDHHTRSCCLL